MRDINGTVLYDFIRINCLFPVYFLRKRLGLPTGYREIKGEHMATGKVARLAPSRPRKWSDDEREVPPPATNPTSSMERVVRRLPLIVSLQLKVPLEKQINLFKT